MGADTARVRVEAIPTGAINLDAAIGVESESALGAVVHRAPRRPGPATELGAVVVLDGLSQFLGLLGVSGFEGLLDLVRPPPDRRALFLRHLSKSVEGLHQGRTTAQIGHPPALQRLRVLHGSKRSLGRLLDLVHLFQLCDHNTSEE